MLREKPARPPRMHSRPPLASAAGIWFMKGDKDDSIWFVAARAMTDFDKLGLAERIRLLEGLALIFPKPEADVARQTAFMMHKAEEHQGQLQALLMHKQEAASRARTQKLNAAHPAAAPPRSSPVKKTRST